MNDFHVLPLAIGASLAMLAAGLILALVRVLRGPSLPDRVVALDLMGALSVGMIAIYAISAEEPIFLRVAIVLALIAFLGTVAFAYYIEKAGMS
jgi:multicomponent Na+:H+ antiporter subunit F